MRQTKPDEGPANTQSVSYWHTTLRRGQQGAFHPLSQTRRAQGMGSGRTSKRQAARPKPQASNYPWSNGKPPKTSVQAEPTGSKRTAGGPNIS